MASDIRDVVLDFIERVAGLRVLVVGETITDSFVPVSYEGQSMKSICPVFRRTGPEVRQQGGAMAIANHLRGFVREVSVVTNNDREITKTRFVDVSDKKKHFEVNEFPVFTDLPRVLDTDGFDVVVLADFGHGFCDALRPPASCHVMCQTNSNNFGFNRLSKWKNAAKRSACLDLREASLQLNRRLAAPSDDDIKMILSYEINADHLFLTLGQSGACWTDGKTVSRHPSFRSTIVDTIGSGDTFFAFSSLASHISADPTTLLLIPSLAASLSTTWACNERSVSKSALLEYALLY